MAGISGGDLLSAYAVNADQHDGFHWASLSRRPSSIFLLGKENARNSAGGLIEALMMHLTLQGIMGKFSSVFVNLYTALLQIDVCF